MKKILFVLLAAITFTACGSDDPVTPPDPNNPSTSFDNWNDPKSTHYTDGKYNPIAGEWQLSTRDGIAVSDFVVYKFDTNFTLSKATVEPAEDKHPTYSDAKAYQINDKAYKIGDVLYAYTPAGSLENATLTIKEGNNTLSFTLYVSKVWSWKGDWNDPKDPHYAIHNGKYNPIKGTWKMTHVGGRPTTERAYYRFNDDFTVEENTNPTGTFRVKRKYWINDIGVKEDSFTIESYFRSYTYSYKIEGNTLHYRGMLPNKGNGLTLIRPYALA